MGQRIQVLKERALYAVIFTGIFLPARLFFYTYVSQYWIGSFGLMTAILLGTLYLSKKDRLGYIGRIITKHTHSLSKGKTGKIAIIYMLFSIYMFSNMIYGMEHAPIKTKTMATEQLGRAGVHDTNTLVTQSGSLHWDGPAAAFGILFSIAIILIPNGLGYALFSIINDYTHGWALHFSTVILVEELEIFGLVIYFRYFAKAKVEQ